ncbi:hypothetical protein T265_14917, partial [Opisthorchis viverrini]
MVVRSEAFVLNIAVFIRMGTSCQNNPMWLKREFTDRKVRGSNPTSASRLFLSRLWQPDSIPALVLSSGDIAARHRKGVTAERRFHFFGIQYIMIMSPIKSELERYVKQYRSIQCFEAASVFLSMLMTS